MDEFMDNFHDFPCLPNCSMVDFGPRNAPIKKFSGDFLVRNAMEITFEVIGMI